MLFRSVAGFYNDKSNSQQFRFVPEGTLNAVIAIDEIDIIGGELEFTALATDDLTLRGFVGYVNAEIDRFSLDPGDEGNRAPYVPEVTAGFGVNHVWTLPSDWFGPGLAVITDIQYEFRGSQFWDTNNTPGSRRDALNLVNGRVALQAERWALALWAKNLGDLDYHSEVITILTDPAVLTQAVHKAPPRTWGLEFEFRF